MLFADRHNGRPPQQARAIVVVFTIPGCGACETYVPVFRHVASQFPGIPHYVIDAGTPQGSQYADRFGVEATPTTMVLRNPVGALKAEGALSAADVQQLFAIAAAQR